MMRAGVECVVGTGALLGECPLWSAADERLYWVDIDGRAIHRYDPVTGQDANGIDCSTAKMEILEWAWKKDDLRRRRVMPSRRLKLEIFGIFGIADSANPSMSPRIIP